MGGLPDGQDKRAQAKSKIRTTGSALGRQLDEIDETIDL